VSTLRITPFTMSLFLERLSAFLEDIFTSLKHMRRC
jgi:hypothetical protein